MWPLSKLIVLLILIPALFGCGLCGDGSTKTIPSSQQSTSKNNDVPLVIPQIIPPVTSSDTATNVLVTPVNTPINHPLVTEHTPSPINQPLAEATRIPPATYIPRLIDDDVPDLIASVNNFFFDGVLDGYGTITIGESTIEALVNATDRAVISYRMPSLMTKLTDRSLNGRLSLNHVRSISGSHKETKIYENATLIFANINMFSEDPINMVITNDLTLVQSEVLSETDQIIIDAPVVAPVNNQQSIPIPLNTPTIISRSFGSFEVYLQSSSLYQSNEPGSDAPTQYSMSVWIIKVV